MTKLIADKLVESIEIHPTKKKNSLRPIEIKGAEEILVLTSALSFFNWNEMIYVASGVLDQEEIGSNGTGFRYPTDELDPGEEPLEGVEIYNPIGELQLSIFAFECLMTRYFRAMIVEAETNNLPVIHQSWWSEFLKITEQIEQRLQKAV